MTARHAWREAHRAARLACPAKGWVRAGFPPEWMAEAAARRLGMIRGLRPAPCRVASMLAVASVERRKGHTEAARLVIGFARKANADRLTPSPAIGA